MTQDDRERFAFIKACAIIRGVFTHPSGFLLGLHQHEATDPFFDSVALRLTQLGYQGHEIDVAYSAAWKTISPEFEAGLICEAPRHWWGRA